MHTRKPHLAVVDDEFLEASHKDQRQQRRDVLPLSLPPRGLSRIQAAAYLGVSPSHLDKLIRDRAMPPPKRLGGRVVWDRKQLDGAFDALDGEFTWSDDDAGDANSWDQSLQRARKPEIHK